MTVIVAVKDRLRGVTVMGGDCLRTVGRDLVVPLPEAASKVYRTGGFVIGHTGARRIRNITQSVQLRFGSDGPSRDFDLERELIESLLPAFRNEARKLGFINEEKGKVPDIGGRVLMAVGTQLCMIHNDLSVTPIAQDFWAIGSGELVALGALEALRDSDLATNDIVFEALRAAAKYVPSVGAPFVFETTVALG